MAFTCWSNKHFVLSNGLHLPAIGLGTFKIRKESEIDICVKSAICSSKYKLIDTASVYKNETYIATALKDIQSKPDFNIKREDIFITTKLSPKDHGADKCRSAIKKSLENLGIDYLDLYLIHWPGVQGLAVDDSRNSELRLESWKVIEEFYEIGIFKSIGVSNYNVTHLNDLLTHCKIRPHVNQIEVHPHYPQTDLVKFCRENNIHIQAYSSLGTTLPTGENQLLKDKTANAIAERIGRSSAQVLLVWALQKEFSVIPKSTNPGHIEENIKLDFKLSDEDMKNLDDFNIRQKYAWNPDLVV